MKSLKAYLSSIIYWRPNETIWRAFVFSANICLFIKSLGLHYYWPILSSHFCRPSLKKKFSLLRHIFSGIRPVMALFFSWFYLILSFYIFLFSPWTFYFFFYSPTLDCTLWIYLTLRRFLLTSTKWECRLACHSSSLVRFFDSFRFFPFLLLLFLFHSRSVASDKCVCIESERPLEHCLVSTLAFSFLYRRQTKKKKIHKKHETKSMEEIKK